MFEDSPITAFLESLKNSRTQSLLDRADELRARLLKITLVVVFFFIGSMVFAKEIFAVLKRPLTAALPAGTSALHFTGPMEVFMSYVQVAFLLAAMLAAPVVLFQLWRFVAPALPKEQHGLLRPCFFASFLLFAGGVAFCFFVMLPPALLLLIGMGTEVATPIITVDDYTSLLLFMMLGFGAAFQLPLVIILLERLGLISVETLSKNRGGILVGILAIAAVATPTPDPFSQLAMAAPMYVMFEAAILIIKRLDKKAP